MMFVSFNSNKTGATSAAGIGYISGPSVFTLVV